MENDEVMMVEERSNRKMNIPFILRIVGSIALVITIISVSTGLYKLYAYENPYEEEYLMGEVDVFDEDKAVNAYNYIDVQNIEVNAGLATAYFTLSILFTIIAIGSFVMAEMVKRNDRMALSKSFF